MSYLSRPGRSSRVPLGWWDSVMTVCSTFGLGDVASSSSAAPATDVEQLQRQINRYTLDGGAPVELRVGASPLPVTGMVDTQTATRALWIMQRRAGQANIEWGDGASKEILAEAMNAWGSPVTFVTKNLSRVIQIVKLYADKNGIPGPRGTLAGMTPTVVAAGLALGALVLMRRKGGR